MNLSGQGAPQIAYILLGEPLASQVTAPKATGLIFAGWYLDAALTLPYDPSTPLTDDLQLFAAWKKAPGPSPARPADDDALADTGATPGAMQAAISAAAALMLLGAGGIRMARRSRVGGLG